MLLASTKVFLMLPMTVNCFEASFVWPPEDYDAVINIGPQVLHDGNISCKE